LYKDTCSTTFEFGDFQVWFKKFEFGPVKQLYIEMKVGLAALGAHSRRAGAGRVARVC
jgi:hypothetical protein